MENKDLLYRLEFSDDDLIAKSMSFPKDSGLSKKLGTVYYYGKGNSEQVKTRFYWINGLSLTNKDIKVFHERIWNENKTDLLFIEKENELEIKYVNTSPKEELIQIQSINTNIEDAELLDRISKEHITSGAFWLEYSEALERIKKQRRTVDQALVESLSHLRKTLDGLYATRFTDKKERSEIVQALIDRTLFIKFLENKKIINSEFYKTYFGSGDIYYKDLLEQKDAQKINQLFCSINDIFKNKLFETPEIENDALLDTALNAIYQTIKGTLPDGQLSLFDFQFDIIPIEFISHIYQIFLDEKKAQQGIFYTPEGLANLVLDEVIKGKQGRVLDPSCGSGIFLVLAFRKMYKEPDERMGIYEKIQHRLDFIEKNIFGIELENTAARLAIFSLYLEVLNDITPEELNRLVAELIKAPDNKSLFTTDFSKNIREGNALKENSAFDNEKFDYIVGNPPWFRISKNATNPDDKINYTYWNKYKDKFSIECQISQCFLHRIKHWSDENTKFGFIVNSSNFANESDKFQQFVFSSYRLQKIFEFYHVKDILFDFAKEPACLLVFDNHLTPQNTVEYFLPKLNRFSETFKTILLNQDDIIAIEQSALSAQKIKLRDYSIGTAHELSLANKLEQECASITDIMLVDRKYDSYRGFEDWGEDALKKEFREKKETLSSTDYDLRKQSLLDKYYSKTKDSEHTIPFIKSSQLDRFHTKEIDTYCREDISNFHRPRNPFIYEGNKILCSRIGGEIKSIYLNDKIYFGTDIYIIKLKYPELYHTITCCLNSDLLNYFSQVKLRKRIDIALSRLDSSDLKRIPVPKRFDVAIVEKLNILSKEILEKKYSYVEKKEEMNELVFDLYDLTYIERQRISDFFVSPSKKLTKSDFENYCKVFAKTISRYIKTGIVKMEYSYNPNMPVAGVKIIFGENSNSPEVKKVQQFITYQLIKQVGNSVLLTLKERIYSDDSIFILKDTNPKSWTKSAAYDDANVEIDKLMRYE